MAILDPASISCNVYRELASKDYAIIRVCSAGTRFRLEEPGYDWRPIHQLRYK